MPYFRTTYEKGLREEAHLHVAQRLLELPDLLVPLRQGPLLLMLKRNGPGFRVRDSAPAYHPGMRTGGCVRLHFLESLLS